MDNANDLFADAVERYPDFKGHFKRFCEKATERLNRNAFLPDVDFYAHANGTSAELRALDRTFEISLRFSIAENIPLGILQVALLEENKEPVRLFHLFFDNSGNVKPTPDARELLHALLSSTGFVETFVNRVAHEYFSHLSAVLESEP